MPAKKKNQKFSQMSSDKKTKKDVKNEISQNDNSDQNLKKLIPSEQDKSALREIESKKLKYIATLNINSYLSKTSMKDKKDAIEGLLDEENCLGVMITEINVRNKFDKKLQIKNTRYIISPQASDKHGGIIFY